MLRSTMTGSPSGFDVQLSALIPQRDYSDLNGQDSQLRVWLPDPAKRALEEVCEVHKASMTAYLTEYLASYLFGYHEVLRMRANNAGLYEPPPMRRSCAMSPAPPPPEPDLGKNIFALKIWVPDKIKNGLQLAADRAGITLGEFSRALICAHLFGREYGPSRLMEGTSLNATVAKSWENEH
ncbi:MAG: hypothetical protein Q8O25_14355 [Sulfurisoma sp.]|nr:hypothetical protein [Sulfurisoma sp.]